MGVYWELLKPRVMSLVVFTALVGLLAAPGPIHPVLGFAAVFFIALGGGASGALNMWYDRDMDAAMARTAARPIPSGRIDAGSVLGYGVGLSVLSVLSLGLFLNWVAAGLLAMTIFFYVIIYTIWLKRRTPQNIVIGGAAGAFPPMIGWAAVTGSVSIESILLFAIVFMWTPPHFWALSLFTKMDYEAAGVPMLPVVAGEPATRRQIFIYSLLLAPLGVAPWLIGMASVVYGAVAIVFGLWLLIRAVAVLRDTGQEPARRLFRFSLLYLFVLFATLGVEATVNRMVG